MLATKAPVPKRILKLPNPISPMAERRRLSNSQAISMIAPPDQYNKPFNYLEDGKVWA